MRAESFNFSDTTKDRFISAYCIPDKPAIRSAALFNALVLELVKLVQSALAICGLLESCRDERSGLLCDATCDGLRRWVTEIGEPCIKLEVSSSQAFFGGHPLNSPFCRPRNESQTLL